MDKKKAQPMGKRREGLGPENEGKLSLIRHKGHDELRRPSKMSKNKRAKELEKGGDLDPECT